MKRALKAPNSVHYSLLRSVNDITKPQCRKVYVLLYSRGKMSSTINFSSVTFSGSSTFSPPSNFRNVAVILPSFYP